MNEIIDKEIKKNESYFEELILAFEDLPKYKQFLIVFICGLSLFILNFKL